MADGRKRLPGVEFTYPICLGTVAFFLGKKADEYHSHRWTVYVRGLNNEDLSFLLSKVVFKLHHSFANPVRVVETQPYELTETGWGEFDISITLCFNESVGEKDVELFHRLRLYSDKEGAAQSTKKPVVKEMCEQLVFWEPYDTFHAAATTRELVPTPNLSSLAQWYPKYNEQEELDKLMEARQKVAKMVEALQHGSVTAGA